MILSLAADRDAGARIRWFGKRRYPFAPSVNAGAIRQAAERMRNRLDLLANWSASLDPAWRHRELVELAKLGRSLRYLLTRETNKDRESKELEAWIDEQSTRDDELSIEADATFKVPWGLVYDGDLPAVAATGDGTLRGLAAQEIELFRNFWCLKYRLSAQTSSTATDNSMRRPRATFGLLSLVNQQALRDAKNFNEYDDLLRPPVGVAYDFDSCRNMIEDSKQRDILFHFYGHHKGATLDVGSGDAIDFASFSQLIDALSNHERVPGAPPCGLVFLNGCETAVGDHAQVDLREAANRAEVCGVIATEAIVQRDFAAEFGRRLLDALAHNGETVADAMYTLHRDPDLWPQSLLYGCYAEADYCVEKMPPSPPGDTTQVPAAAAAS